MKSFAKIIVFKIGIDVLGFPLYHNHKLILGTDSQYITNRKR